MSSPLYFLLTALVGLGAAVFLLSDVAKRFRPARDRWILSAAVVGVVVLAASVPGKLHSSTRVLNEQRKLYRETGEDTARARCLNDMNRPDLVESLEFARQTIPGDAGFVVKTSAQSIACIMDNLFPRRPVREWEYDPASHWIVLDAVAPDQVSPDLGAIRDAALDESRHVTHPPSLILVRPEGEAP